MGLLGSVKRIQDRIMGNDLVKFLMRVIKQFGINDGTTLAAGISYYIFLSAFPLILVSIGLLGYFLPSATVQDQLFTFFRSNIPGAVDVLQNNIQKVISLRGTLGGIGLVLLLWSGSGAISAIGHGINRAWNIPREMEFYLKKPRDIGLTLGLGILFFLSLGAHAIFTFVPVQNIPVIGSSLVQIGLRIISFLLAWAIFLILFKVIPNTKTYWRYIWFGAFITALLFELGRSLIFFYLTTFVHYQLVYGSIASVIIFLVWIFYTAIIIILGSELTAEYGRMRRGIGQGVHSHTTAKPVTP